MRETDDTGIARLEQEVAKLRAQLAVLEARVTNVEASRGKPAEPARVAPTASGQPVRVSVEEVPDSGTTGVAPPPPPMASATPASPAGWVPAPAPVMPRHVEQATQQPAGAMPHASVSESPQHASAGNSEDLESQMGLRWVNRIGALTLVLAALFVFKYAADNNWIGPGLRVALGLLTGLAVVGLAEYLWRRTHHTVAQGIAGLGAAILYLSVFAAHGWYDLLPQLAAFGGLAMVVLLTAVLALRYQTQALAILAGLGAVLAPPILSSDSLHVWPMNAYLLLVAAGSVYLAVLRGWMLQAWLAYLPLKALFWFSVIDSGSNHPFSPVLIFGIAFYSLYLFAPSRAMVALAQTSFAVALVATARLADLPVSAWHLLLPVVAGIGISVWRRDAVTAGTAMCSAYGLALLLYLYGLDNTSEAVMAAGAVGLIGLALLWLAYAAWIPWGWLRREDANEDAASALYALNALGFALTAVLHFQANAWPDVALLLFGLGGLHFALSTLPATETPFTRFSHLRLVTQASGAFLVAWAIPLQFAGVVVTSLWSLLAAALAWLSRAPRRWWLDAGAILLMALSWLRYLEVDLDKLDAQTTAFANAAFLGGLLCAIAIFAAAWAWRQTLRSWTPYVFGHLFVFTALLSNLWRMSDTVAAEGDVILWRNATLSVLLSVYAFGFVAAGIALRSRANRLAGLCILLLVVAKLYLYDVWQLDTLFRIVAFAALGTALLATSFLYSRLKHTLRQLLQNEQNAPETEG